ncbi:MAG: hypothetical protein ACFB6R_14815 [Alphaproteobacteria bacterium]
MFQASHSMKTGILGLILAALVGAASPAFADVVVNGVPLDPQTRQALAQTYGAVPDGRYWYDPSSGLWGVEGGPSVGRILPGLTLGGPLQANASGGGYGQMTGVFINGREIHPQEHALLARLFGYVNPGRYWLGPTLLGGYEGGPAQFNLRAAASGGGGGGGYNRKTLFGGLMSDGQCSGYLHPGGATVMTGNC